MFTTPVCHMSHVMCHVSHVKCQGVTFFCLFFLFLIGLICGASWWRVCYQRGLPRLVNSIVQMDAGVNLCAGVYIFAGALHTAPCAATLYDLLTPRFSLHCTLILKKDCDAHCLLGFVAGLVTVPGALWHPHRLRVGVQSRVLSVAIDYLFEEKFYLGT